MKRFLMIVLMICFVFASTSVNADKLKLNGFTASMGKSAVSSGLTASFFFGNKTSEIEITGNNSMSCLVYFFKIKNLPAKIEVGPYFGYYQNIVNLGIYAKASIKFLNVFYWRGWEFGDGDEGQSWKVGEFFDMWGSYINVWKFSVGYSYLNFRGTRNYLPGLSLNIPLNKKFTVFAGVDYKISKKCENEPLFKLGLTYRPRK